METSENLSRLCALDDAEMESETAEQCDQIFPTNFINRLLHLLIQAYFPVFLS
jgi:hypothetical protein